MYIYLQLLCFYLAYTLHFKDKLQIAAFLALRNQESFSFALNYRNLCALVYNIASKFFEFCREKVFNSIIN